MCVPLLMVGIFSYVVLFIPIEAVQGWYETTAFGQDVFRFFKGIYNITYNAVSIYLCITVSYMYASHFYKKGSRFVIAAAMLASFISVLFCLGFAHTGFDVSRYDAQGVFTAFVVSILCIRLFFSIFNYIDKKRAFSFDSNIQNRINTIYWLSLPFSICLVVFYTFNELIYKLTGMVSLNELFTVYVSAIFVKLGTSYLSALLLMGSESLMWFVGIHGGSVMEQVMTGVFAPANYDPTVIVSRTFIDTFALIGGCGTALSLFLAMLMFEKRKEQKAILKTVAFPILFNVNEPLVFGVPIIFNPILIIPFILTPLVSISIAYGATVIGFMPVTHGNVAWTTPIFLSGFAATGSWRGAFVQLIIVLAGTLVYIPFVKLMNKAGTGTDIVTDAMEKYYREHMDDAEPVAYLKQHNSWGVAAATLVAALKEDVASERIQMHYQPQMDQEGHVYGAEALLRWKYGGRTLFPPFVIHMSHEAHVEDQLGRCILRRVCRDMVKLREDGLDNLYISVNFSGNQLNDNAFVRDIILITEHYKVSRQICVEVTEEVAIDKLTNVPQNIKRLNKEGIQVSMDDFSMGTTSIKNLRENNFSHVKLDGSLVADMADNERSRDIVSSIISLGDSLGFRVVAEYVDTQQKLDELKGLGCDYFQGYFYSPAVPLEAFVEYAKEKEEKNSHV